MIKTRSIVKLCRKFVEMKFTLVFLLLLISTIDCFLNFPPSGDDAVASFLNTIKINSTKVDNEESFFEKNSIRGDFCNRECRDDDRRVCHFKFMIKYYQVMSG